MKKILFGLAATGLVLFAAALPARALDDGVTIVKAPVRFIVNGQVLPAGTYRITKTSPDDSVLMVTNESDRVPPVMVATNTLAGPPEDGVARVQFKNYRGQYFLSTVAFPGQDVREVVLRAPDMDHVLARLNLLRPEPALGASAR